jgi:hypothetical protein
MENSITKKLVQEKWPYHFKEQDAGCLGCWWGTYSTWRECADVHRNKSKTKYKSQSKGKCQVCIPSTAKYVYMYLYKGATTYPAIPTSTSIFIRIYIKRKPYTHICCILDYLNACVLQKRAWPNSINSSKYTKLRYYWMVVNFIIITKLVECIYQIV